MRFAKIELAVVMTALFCSSVSAQAMDIRSCSETARGIAEVNIIGKTEHDLSVMFCDVSPPDRSFDLLVSKNLHPYQVPLNHRLLRVGRDYIVFELDETDHVIKIHKVHG